MRSALIGYSGFVGGTLASQRQFTELYNSKNIHDIREQKFDIVVCAGAPAAKWLANQQPEEDLRNLQNLMGHLKAVQVERFVLISTVDVYPNPIDVDEDSVVDSDLADPYGKHRYYLEEFVRETFAWHNVIRLPGLFGHGLKKNFIYDLLHANALDYTHTDSKFQWYDMSRLRDDLELTIQFNLSLVNFATEPVRCGDIANECFGIDFENITERGPVFYDMRTIYSRSFNGNGCYLYDATETLKRITRFVRSEQEFKAP